MRIIQSAAIFSYCIWHGTVVFAMSDILRSDLYSIDIFNALPDFSDTVHNGLEKENEISELVQMFVDYDINQYYGLSLLHKHFDLFPGEKMVETIDLPRKRSVATPRTVFNESMSDNVYPFRFQFMDEGYWVPLEYSLFDSKHNPSIPDKYHQLAQNKEFLTNFGNKLKEKQFQNIFGIGIKTRNGFAAFGTYETGEDDDQRVLISRAKDENNTQSGKSGCVRRPAFWSLETVQNHRAQTQSTTQECSDQTQLLTEECDDCPVQTHYMVTEECDDCPVQTHFMVTEECDDCPVQTHFMVTEECDDCPVQTHLMVTEECDDCPVQTHFMVTEECDDCAVSTTDE